MKTLTILVSLIIFGCSTSPTGRSQLTLMPKGQMAQMGDQSFAQLKKTTKISSDPKLNNKIKCLARRIVTNMDQDNDFSEWEVTVFDDKQVNAFALPGKNIGVYTGLIKAAKNNDQIASVLGHEVGHVLAEHGNERVSQNLVVQGGLLASSIALDTGSSAKNNLIIASLGIASQVGVLLPFSRKHESEADEIGQNLMAKAGFDPRESVAFWKIMQKEGGSAPPEWLSTHPANQSRINGLESNMEKAMGIYQENKAKYSDCP